MNPRRRFEAEKAVKEAAFQCAKEFSEASYKLFLRCFKQTLGQDGMFPSLLEELRVNSGLPGKVPCSSQEVVQPFLHCHC